MLAGLGASHRLAALGGWLTRLAEAGTDGYPPETKRRLMILNMIAYLIAVSTLVYFVQQTFLDYDRYWPIVYINLAIVIVMLAVPSRRRC
jgi:adenylate cyclase